MRFMTQSALADHLDRRAETMRRIGERASAERGDRREDLGMALAFSKAAMTVREARIIEPARDLTLPSVHLNGSGADRLSAQYRVALEKAQEALQALQSCDVHARDYYPQGEAAIQSALDEHRARLGALSRIVEDLSKIIEHVEQ